MTASTSEPAAIEWIEHEVVAHHGKQAELPAANNNLCEFLRDGRAVIWLITALAADADHFPNNDALAIPKKIERSMHQLSTFHALERIAFFIRWCRTAAKLEEHLVFTSVQLLDEANADAVLATIDALRQRFRPTLAKAAPTPTPTPVQQQDEEEDDEDNNAIEIEAAAAPPTSTNKLSAFLTAVPTGPPTLVKHVSTSSVTSATSRDDDATDTTDTRFGVSKLKKLPGAFASLATVTPASPPPPPPPQEEPPVEEEPEYVSSTPNRDDVDHYDERIKHVSKLEIPTVFGRQQSGDADENKTVKRAVSKLRIPTAFGGASDATPAPVEEPAAPVPEEPVSNSPKSKLAAFAKSLAPTPEPTPVVAAEAPKRKKSTAGKLKIPGVFGKAVGAAAPVPKKKPVTKLSAFLNTVNNDVPKPMEAKSERKFAFPIPGTEEAKSPVKKQPVKAPVTKPAPAKNVALAAFMQKVVVKPPTPAPRVERDVVPDHPIEHVEQPKQAVVEIPPVVEEKVAPAPASAPSPSKPSALAAFMKKVVVGPPTPAPRVERDDVSAEVKHVEEVKEAVVEAAPVEAEPIEQEPAVPSPPKSNRLHAFLAAVSPQASASEESEEDEEEVEEITASAIGNDEEHDEEEDHEDLEEEHEEDEEGEEEQDEDENEDEEAEEEHEDAGEVATADQEPETVEDVDAEGEEPVHDDGHDDDNNHDDDHDDDFVSPVVESFPDHHVIVEVSGELTHEAMRRRLSSQESAPMQDAPAPTAAITTQQPENSNETLQQQLASVEATVKIQNDALEALRAELAVLRQQVETQKSEAEVAQEAAVAAVRRELETTMAEATATLQAQVAAQASLAAERLEELTAVKQTLADQELELKQAHEGAEAERYAAQTAFAARDELQDKLNALTQ